MTSRSQALYEACLRRVLEISRERTGRSPRPLLLVIVYEIAIYKLWRQRFPLAKQEEQ